MRFTHGMTQDIHVPTEVKAHYIMARTDAESSLLSHNCTVCTGVGHKAQGAKIFRPFEHRGTHDGES